METLTIGKIRGLQGCATPRGAFSLMALDHRQNLRRMLRPQDPESVSAEEMTELKREIVAALAPASSAVLLDPEVSAAQCVASGTLPGRVGLVTAVEATGYGGEPTARQSRILEGWSVAKAKRMGASAVKLLVYYHPDSRTAGEIERFVQETAAECSAQDMALLLEPLSYPLDPGAKKLPPEERRRVVTETARRLVVPGVDVLKAEFPLDTGAEPDERRWEEACAELTEASPAPWVLLSASAPYETYLRQVVAACQAGASGVAAGRAVWQEAPALQGEDRRRFLEFVARPRMARLTALVNALARPWTERYRQPEPGPEWFSSY